MKIERVGIYGGTFSPPHNGHVHAARLFLEQEKPDKLLIIPVCLPPHKRADGAVTSEDRLAMCRAAFGFSDRVEVSDLEIRRAGKSYTVETLRALSAPNRRLLFLCGSDMLPTLPEWQEAEELFRLTEFVYLNRDCDDVTVTLQAAERFRREYGAVIRRLDGEIVVAASRSIRELRQSGADWRASLPAAVADYIEKRGLYL